MAAEPSPEQSDIDQILKGITIPSPPQIMADLQIEMLMPDPDLNAMATLISKDVGLAGCVLKAINSPFYGGNNVSSISQAVMMLGMTTVVSIVNTLQMRATTSGVADLSEDMIVTLNKFWDSATDVARSCMLIAQRLHFKQADMAYTLGLFHNAGIPLLMQRFPDYPQVLKKSYLYQDGRIIDSENIALKTNHAVISYYVARSWKLPEAICNIIAAHHNSADMFGNQSGFTDEQQYFLAILKMAEHIASLHRIIGDQETDFEWNDISNDVLDCLGISEFDFEDIVSYAEEHGIGVQSYFM